MQRDACGLLIRERGMQCNLFPALFSGGETFMLQEAPAFHDRDPSRCRHPWPLNWTKVAIDMTFSLAFLSPSTGSSLTNITFVRTPTCSYMLLSRSPSRQLVPSATLA